jgi:GTP-binding protein
MIKSARFVTSVASEKQIFDSGLPEIAVCGKSNSGKSSFINMLTCNSKLAKTSKAPGRTRLINYFECNGGQFYLVDLPGYGYAQVSAEQKALWGRLIEKYFSDSKSLRHVFLLLDIRRDPSSDDIDMINYLYHYDIPFTIIASKSDKLSRSAAFLRKKKIAAAFKIGEDNILMVSNLNLSGKQEVMQKINQSLAD